MIGIVTMAGMYRLSRCDDPIGRFLALEVKTETGRVSKEQTMFLALVNKRGGYACVVRSVEDAIAAVDAAANGDAPGVSGRRC